MNVVELTEKGYLTEESADRFTRLADELGLDSGPTTYAMYLFVACLTSETQRQQASLTTALIEHAEALAVAVERIESVTSEMSDYLSTASHELSEAFSSEVECSTTEIKSDFNLTYDELVRKIASAEDIVAKRLEAQVERELNARMLPSLRTLLGEIAKDAEARAAKPPHPASRPFAWTQ